MLREVPLRGEWESKSVSMTGKTSKTSNRGVTTSELSRGIEEPSLETLRGKRCHRHLPCFLQQWLGGGESAEQKGKDERLTSSIIVCPPTTWLQACLWVGLRFRCDQVFRPSRHNTDFANTVRFQPLGRTSV